MIERAEVSSSRSTLEVYESRWRKGLDGWDKTDADYLTPDDSSCSREVACHKVGWKPRIRQERLGLGMRKGYDRFDSNKVYLKICP